MSATKTKQFTSGKWTGYYILNGERKEMALELQFDHAGTLSGTGQDAVSFFRVAGTYKPTPPYNATLTRTDFQGNGKMGMTGFRESDTGGIFGTWNGTLGSGDFRIIPATSDTSGTFLAWISPNFFLFSSLLHEPSLECNS